MFPVSSGKRGQKRKSQSPLSQSAKRHRVSFGKQLSPEYFDKRLPASTPVRKGSTPRRKSGSIGAVETKPLLKVLEDARQSKKSPRSTSKKSPRRRSTPVKAGSPKQASPAKSPQKTTPVKSAKSPKRKSVTKSPKRNTPTKSPKRKTSTKSPKRKTPTKSPQPSTSVKSPKKKTPSKKLPGSAVRASRAAPRTPRRTAPKLALRTPSAVSTTPPMKPTPAKMVAIRAIYGKIATPKLPNTVKCNEYRQSPRKSVRKGVKKSPVSTKKTWSEVVKQGRRSGGTGKLKVLKKAAAVAKKSKVICYC